MTNRPGAVTLGLPMEDRFTAREVAVLLEDIRGEFRAGFENLASLPEDMLDVKERLTRVEDRLTRVEDVLRVGFPDFSRRVARLESKVGL